MKSYVVECGKFKLELGLKTCVMGILNVTPDSFSDGGDHADTDIAVAHARLMVKDGAGIIDIGGESSRPYAEDVPIQEEIRRVVPVIERLCAENIPVPISVDTVHAEVAEKAIRAGATIVNDISAMSDPDMATLVASENLPIILMHMQGIPASMQDSPSYDHVTTEISSYLEQAALRGEKAGILRSKIILDPGIGFGKTREHNLQILRELSRFKALNYPLLVGASRKSFIQSTLSCFCGDDPKEKRAMADLGTHAVTGIAVAGGAHIIRVHDVPGTVATVAMVDAVLG